MNQKILIKRCKLMIDKYGTQQIFIANGIGCSKNTISLFLKEERILSEKLENSLTSFLEERNC